MRNVGPQFFLIKRTMRFGRKVLYLLLFHRKCEANTVVFDFPYFDLVEGSTTCTARLPGAHMMPVQSSRRIPRTCLTNSSKGMASIRHSQWIYGFAWPSSERCQTMGDALAEGVALRSKIALWLLKERFSDWELALIGVSESHSALEALWHGIDERHPLHSHSSSRAAAEGVHNVYRGDRPACRHPDCRI